MIQRGIYGLARLISILFHPIFMPILGISLLFYTNSYISYTLHKEMKNAVLLLVGLNTIAMPVLITSFLLWRGIISSVKMAHMRERTIPYAGTLVFYALTIYLLKDVYLPAILVRFMVAALISVFCAFIINFFWKISAHLIGMGGLCGALACISIKLQTDVTLLLLLAIFISGLVGASRLLLKAHSPSQVYAGYFIGFFWQLVLVL